jgi:peptidoglycan/xylan/chitin deacetylase (PgdA/CDA1 family)
MKRDPLLVLFTIDTEISMGGAARDPSLLPVGAKKRIWGETERGRYGISYFMDVFDEYGMKGVFFFEPVARHVVPEAELAEAAKYIVDRGHDVELHVHPEFQMDLPAVQRGESKSPNPSFFEHSLAEQRRYIRESYDTLYRWTGRRPIAFRAGGYGASEVTLAALKAEGIEIDSSYNLWAVQHGWCGMKATPELNDAAVLEPGILEIPVTNLRAKGPRGGLRPFELSALNATEMISMLEEMYREGARVACSVTHSFRLLRARDHQYRDVAVDHFNVHRLRRLCRFLAQNPDRFQVVTFKTMPAEKLRLAPSTPRFASPPLWSSMLRMGIQAIKDRGAV